MIQNINQKPTKVNILVIDDHPDNLRVLSAMLSKQGYHVRKALNGKIALIACEVTPPDLILLDINMPDMDGYEVCQRLKACEKTKDIPVIFLSVLDNVLDKVKAFKAGGADYITKPFHIEEVTVRVENQLNLQRLKNELQEKNRLLEKQNALLIEENEKRRLAESALQQANEKLQKLVIIDSLTEVANRRHFDEVLQKEWYRCQREQFFLSLILCDIDYFKLYNDTYGHLAGDACLRQVAGAITKAVRRSTDLVARYGGEEFAVILPNTNLQGAEGVAQKIQREVIKLEIVNALSPCNSYITLSQGIASVIPSYNLSPDILIANADKTLYQAKQQGRNCYCLCRELELPSLL
ncbi:MAG: PleD family two-component system response regulator [Oscillatoriaceae bacterium SKW80]|nr:PleD family two-component system response regulator [Oscillatoriaceae bacterium SKYG93]MCX8121748.1 PleD family two-component system response regulator [Oscillatoriaceae bacterium SKW80]MDW8453636.1 PleD family two-component system response regulator [Oscillatoriaceae cyanobacterium SKYGB_i_bin93]HIK28701.1 PleD family two-component system response regulator [Oscillatoriaceae cyanobacterium M7585_C2015_266]